MAKGNPLAARFVETVKEAGRYGDGGGTGLFLNVTPTGAKSWLQRITINGKRRELGLGPVASVSLREAREIAAENKKAAVEGRDPLQERKDAQARLTFEQAARETHKEVADSYKNQKDAKAFLSTLTTYVFPRIGRIPIADVTPADIRRIIIDVRRERPEVAKKLNHRISAVFKWSIAEGQATSNPATPDALNLPRTQRKGGHFKALHYNEIAGALETIRETKAWECSKLAIEFIALTACRSGEARGALWSEIDMNHDSGPLWIVPSERMKMGREHRVPLSSQAVAILEQAKAFRFPNDLIFPSVRGKEISDNTLSKLARENEIGTTIHGFRSSFRVWAGEAANAPREVAELALAHEVRSAVEVAYDRDDRLRQRAALMQRWGDFIEGNTAKVIMLNSGSGDRA